METRANYLLIGAFTVLSLIMAVIFTVWIANAGLDKSYSLYDVKFEGPIRGVELGGEVRFNGIKVGEVTRLSLDKDSPKLVVARIRVLSDTPVKSDSIAQLEPAGLTGLAYIQILAGSQNAGPLTRKKGEEKPVISTRRGQLDRLFQGGQGVVDTSLETLNRMKLLLDEKNLTNFAITLDNTRRASELIGERGQLLDKANDAAKNLNDAGIEVRKLAELLANTTKSSSENINKTVTTYAELGQYLIEDSREIKTKTNSILDDGQLLVKDLKTLSGNTNSTILHSQKTLKEIDETNKVLKEATYEVKKASEGISSASISVNDFFLIGANETLPDLSAAAKKIEQAGESVDSLVGDAASSPSGLLSKPQSAKVKWKK